MTKPEELSEELPQKVDVITLALCEVDDYVPQLGRLYRFEMHEKCDACLRISTPNNIDAEGFEWPAYPREEVSAVGKFRAFKYRSFINITEDSIGIARTQSTKQACRIMAALSREKASQKPPMETTFANIKYLHSLCEGALSGLTACPEKFHVDAEPEAVRLDIGNEFHRMTADEAAALGNHLVMVAFRQQRRGGDFSCGPRLDPKWLKKFLEDLMRDWPKGD